MSTAANNYFCHQCQCPCTPDPNEFVCPFCNEGFIEPISPSPRPFDNPFMNPLNMEASPANNLVRDILQSMRMGRPGFHGGSINRRATSVNRGASSVNRGASSVNRGASSVNRGASSVNRGASSVNRGASSVNRGASSMSRGAGAPSPSSSTFGGDNGGGGSSVQSGNTAPSTSSNTESTTREPVHQHRIHSSTTGPIRISPIHRSRLLRVGRRGDGVYEGLSDVPTLFNHIITSLGGDVQVMGNPGDYAWGPNGLDNVITQLISQLDGSGPPPAQDDKIERLPDVTVPQKCIDDKLDCTVCQDYFEADVKVKQLPCKHYFHKDCIIPWLKLHNSCPICRIGIDEADIPDDVPMAEQPTEEPAPAQTPANNIHEEDLD